MSKIRGFLHLTVVLALVLASLLTVAPASARPVAKHAPDSLLVRFHPDTPAADKSQARGDAEGEVVEEYDLVPGLQHLRVPAGRLEHALQSLARSPFVEYVEPDYEVYSTALPNDPRYADLWGMANIHAPAAWDVFTGDANLVVADIDTGIDYNHPDLAGNIWTNPGEIAGNGIDDDGNGYVDDVYGWDFANNDNDPMDDNGHGSHTAGTVGARGNNGVGVAGVNWNVKLMGLKFLSASGSGSTSGAISALNYAVAKGVKVSNSSWGGGGYSTSLYLAIQNAAAKGHIFVAAAGNNGTNNDTSPFYPASYTLDNLIAVASIASDDSKSSFSNYGLTSVDLGAPGSSILSTTPGNSYAYYSGTSMATPHVAGAAALLYGLHPDWTYAQVRDRLFSTARPLAALSGKTVTGGTLDIGAALAGAPPPTPPAAPSGLSATAVSTSQINLAWTDNSGNESGFKVERSPNGTDGWAQIGATGTNVKTYTNTGLPANTPFWYRVRATNSAGDSDYSNVASATTWAVTTFVHVGDLDGASSRQSSTKWKATVTITVHDANHAVKSGVVVSGVWSAGTSGSATCTTGAGGQCSVSKSNLTRGTVPSVTFTVNNLTLAGYAYVAGANHDPDGDSTGTVITVSRP